MKIEERGLFAAPKPAEPTAAEPVEFRGMDEAAKHRLIKGGYLDAATGATRKARARRCTACSLPIWLGIDADWCGRVREADPGPLSPLGEALARFYGWGTLELAWMGNRYELYGRDRWMIAGSPAGTTKNRDVLVEHQCGNISAALIRGASMLPGFEEMYLPIDAPF